MMATHWDWQRPHTRRLAATLLVIVRSKIKESDVKFFQYISLFTSLHLALPSTQCVRPHLSKTGNRDGRLESQRRKSLACSDRVSWPRVILKEMNWFQSVLLPFSNSWATVLQLVSVQLWNPFLENVAWLRRLHTKVIEDAVCQISR